MTSTCTSSPLKPPSMSTSLPPNSQTSTSLSIPHRPSTGADVPRDVRMLINKSRSKPEDQTIGLWAPRDSQPAVTLPIHRRYDKASRRSASAFAVLICCPQNELRAAVSGWSAAFPSAGEHQLRLADAVPRVRAMCAAIDHVLAPDASRDKGQPGRFNACHTKKQVLAYAFVEGLHCKPRQRCKKRWVIHQNFAPCVDCDDCVVAFVQATGVAVTVVVHGEDEARGLAVPATRYLF